LLLFDFNILFAFEVEKKQPNINGIHCK